MAVEVILPVLGETMDEGTIVKWFVDVGQEVQKGAPLYQLETDKAVLEVEAPASGVLRKIFYPAGAKVPVLTVVGLIAAPDEDISAYELSSSERVRSEPAPAERRPMAEGPRKGPLPSRIFASPRARKLAAEYGIDLSYLKGTGPGGRIVEQDVSAAIKAEMKEPSLAPSSVEIMPSPSKSVPLAGVRRIIAERMSTSAHTTAAVTLTTEVDVTNLVELRTVLKQQLESTLGFVISYTDILVAVVARALREYPYMNVRLAGDEIHTLSQIHIGVAVDTERGLLVPVIRHADEKGIVEIARTLRELVERARAGKSLPDDLTGGTFTITNLGMYDIDAFTPIINLPECAILGVGCLRERPAVHEGQVCVRQMMVLSLTFDHRLVDGAPAARFLQRIKQFVEQPYLLLS
ncbi:MAG: dihydrolipoamide acetyltransferase family protein [Anaerolineae bacterium]